VIRSVKRLDIDAPAAIGSGVLEGERIGEHVHCRLCLHDGQPGLDARLRLQVASSCAAYFAALIRRKHERMKTSSS
jgi:hypothetical protein